MIDLLSAGKVEHPQLSVHLLLLQDRLELLEALHHHRVRLEVREVVVDLEQRV